ncbi:DUF1153 domain-containing protein [Candidatus Kaiserbacteria bacterium]|nr:DUF1153 domain-containing protein [Candidatus Kaiserbacteria bacterium]
MDSVIPRDLYGNTITREHLPRSDGRWTPNRKVIVILALKIGLLSPSEALARYGFSSEELLTWQRRFAMHGEDGLKTTRIKRFRKT